MHENIPPPILVTGCARSGNSLVAGVLNMCGAFGGTMSGANKLNGRGVCENDRIHDELVVPYLENLGVDIFCQYPLPSIHKLPIPSDWGRKVRDILYDDGYHGGSWMYKSSKTSLIWPVWQYAFPNAKWVIVRRRTGDIINSCQKTDFMRAFKSIENQQKVYAKSESDGWRWWVHQHEHRLVSLITEGVNCQVLWPERMSHGDYQQMIDTITWLGLRWKTEVFSYIDSKLNKIHKTTQTSSNAIQTVVESLQESYEYGRAI
jgi:hypothetical protein